MTDHTAQSLNVQRSLADGRWQVYEEVRVDRRLRRAVLERLAAVEELALRTSSQLPVLVARNHLKTITGGWRELLLEHQPNDKGRCPVCSGWLRRRRWPCQVWVTAHQHLIGDGSESFEGPGQKSRQSRPPRRVEVIPRQVGVPTAADQRGPVSAQDTAAHAARQRVTEWQDPAGTGSVPIHRATVAGHQPAAGAKRGPC